MRTLNHVVVTWVGMFQIEKKVNKNVLFFGLVGASGNLNVTRDNGLKPHVTFIRQMTMLFLYQHFLHDLSRQFSCFTLNQMLQWYSV